MSGLCGIYHLDGAPVDADLLERMLAVSPLRGPHGCGRWLSGGLGLAQQMLATAPEALSERQPLADQSGQVVLVMDGRVDNRAGLRQALEADRFWPRDKTDAELVLQAYLAWGEDCAARILGDFALAVWDGRVESLFCARDTMGVRPFYYYFDERHFLFGSELRQVLECPGVPLIPNEGMLGEYLCDRITSQSETLYQGVLRLPPAHWLRVGRAGLRLERYWELDLGREIRYKTNTEYAEHFREIFDEAVGCRMRANGKVGAYLSGGLDSSSVVVTMDHLMKTDQVEEREFETFSLVFPGIPAADELPFIQAVEERVGRPGNRLEAPNSPIELYRDQVERYWDMPDYPNGVMMYPIRELARQKEIDVLITGWGGDQWLTSSPYYYADLVKHGRVSEILKLAHIDGLSLPETIKRALLPLLSEDLQKELKRIFRRTRVPSHIRDEYLVRVGLENRIKPASNPGRLTEYAQLVIWLITRMGDLGHSFEINARSSAEFQVEERHPFYDRRVVEFSASIPEEQRRKGLWEKAILRRAMKNRLPQRVLMRIGKADFSHLFTDSIKQSTEFEYTSIAKSLHSYVELNRKQNWKFGKNLSSDSARLPEGSFWNSWMMVSTGLWMRWMQSLSEKTCVPL